jgi:hypothetical protein
MPFLRLPWARVLAVDKVLPLRCASEEIWMSEASRSHLPTAVASYYCQDGLGVAVSQHEPAA